MADGIMADGIMADGIMADGIMADGAALGVFFGLEVLDFDFLTFFCWHLIFLSDWVVLCQ